MATEEINTALEALSKIDASIAGMQESVKKGEAAQADVQKKIDELGEKQVLFSRQLLDIQQKAQKAEGAADLVDKSIGAQFVNSDSYKRFKGTSALVPRRLRFRISRQRIPSLRLRQNWFRIVSRVLSRLTLVSLRLRGSSRGFRLRPRRLSTCVRRLSRMEPLRSRRRRRSLLLFRVRLKQTPVQVIAHLDQDYPSAC